MQTIGWGFIGVFILNSGRLEDLLGDPLLVLLKVTHASAHDDVSTHSVHPAMPFFRHARVDIAGCVGCYRVYMLQA